MQRIAILASGSGSNAREILHRFQNHPKISVGLVISNKREAGVFKHANDYSVTSLHIPRKGINDASQILEILKEHNINWIALAGFLLMIPDFLIDAYPAKIINIHPSLLPKYGGAGMYGQHVHRAVLEAKEDISGMTIHYVNQEYDKGEIIFQGSCSIEGAKSPEEIGQKVLALEHLHYAKILEQTILNQK